MTNAKCEVCGREGKHNDYRVLKIHGGSDLPANKVVLCDNCHIKKKTFDKMIFTLPVNRDQLREWFDLAFQDDHSAREEFLRILKMVLREMLEISDEIDKTPDYAGEWERLKKENGGIVRNPMSLFEIEIPRPKGRFEL